MSTTALTNADAETHQQKLARLEAEVAALRDQLRRAQRLAAVGTMTAMVAHEFNNILTPIINYAQVAQRDPAVADKALARAADGGQRANSICKALLSFTGNGCTEVEQTNIETLISETLSAMARDPRQDGIELVLQSPADLTISARRVELQQVLLNLFLNARQAVLANDGPRRIEITAEPDGRFIVVRVADNGVGIPAENLDKIFQPFFTTRTSTDPETRGNGLGLALCHQIVTSMGGQISVRTDVGNGTTFTVRLPVRSRAPADPPAKARTA